MASGFYSVVVSHLLEDKLIVLSETSCHRHLLPPQSIRLGRKCAFHSDQLVEVQSFSRDLRRPILVIQMVQFIQKFLDGVLYLLVLVFVTKLSKASKKKIGSKVGFLKRPQDEVFLCVCELS